MKKWSRITRWLTGIFAVLLLTLFGAYLLLPRLNLFGAHEHCMKVAGTALLMYASDNNGQFPFHTNGFGDALLLITKADPVTKVDFFTAPDDDGRLLRESLATERDVSEEACTRAYVQGLSETNDLNIAILFDRYPTRGGDHQRRPWGPLQRDVCLLDGSMQTILEEKWPEFRRAQIKLLTAAGISRAEAEKLYEAPVR